MREQRRRAARGKIPKPPGRPRHPQEERDRVRGLVAAQRKLQGHETGLGPILEALRKGDRTISPYLVAEALRDLKRAGRSEAQKAIEEVRVSHEIQARDAVWGEDTTHLGRLEDGSKVEAEVIKDVGTLETVGLSVGDVPCATDVRALMARTALERSGWPLVWMGDLGSINRDLDFVADLARQRVVHVLSRVHTPTDNGATEHQHRELKDESGLGKGVRLSAHDEARARLEAARERLDGHRLRRTKGWRTARELGRTLPRADRLVDRAAFYAAACAAMEEAARGLTDLRAWLAARRQALFATLVSFGLATRHVGPRPRVRPGPPPCTATPDRVESPRACA
jgi:transposase InsO family protein